MFIKIADIKGEAKDQSHKEEIDVLAWSWGVSNSGSAQQGGGSGSGKANVQDLSFTKYIDSSSPALMLSALNGKNYDSEPAILVVRKSGETPVEYLKITMTPFIITSISTGGSGGEDRLTENVTINFGEVDFEYTPQKEDGSADAAIPIGWKIAENVKK
jgi:type VI secretion system secreted protein Hcp